MHLRFRYHCLRRDISNFALIRHRDYTGFLVSMHQSGTHWLKHMLATALAARYGLAPPRYAHANDVIGGVKDNVRHPGAPCLVSSHSIPHVLVGSAMFRRVVRFPPYVVLVRDIRGSLVANYEKWKRHYGCGFSEFLRGDPSGRRFNNDLWWCIRFCNAWGRVAARFPQTTQIIRYEDLQADAAAELGRINDFLSLDLRAADIALGVAESGKAAMAAKADPRAPFGVTVVRNDHRPAGQWFNAADRAFLERTCDRELRCDFGYDYRDRGEAASSS